MSQEFDSEVSSLAKEKDFILLNICLVLKGKGISDKDINTFSKLEQIWKENNKKMSRFVLEM